MDETEVSGESDRARLEGDDMDEDEAEVDSEGDRAASSLLVAIKADDDALDAFMVAR